MNFCLTTEEYKKFQEWKSQKDPKVYTGAIGGRFTFHFTPTSLGCIVKVSDSVDKDEIDLTDYESW